MFAGCFWFKVLVGITEPARERSAGHGLDLSPVRDTLLAG